MSTRTARVHGVATEGASPPCGEATVEGRASVEWPELALANHCVEVSPAPLMTRCMIHRHANAPKRVWRSSGSVRARIPRPWATPSSIPRSYSRWTAGVATHNPPTRRHGEPHATHTSSSPQRARWPESHLTLREASAARATPPATPKDDHRHPHAAQPINTWDCPLKPVVHELSDAVTVSGFSITQPVGPGGESEVHDSEQAPSPPRNDHARKKRWSVLHRSPSQCP